MAKSSRGWPAKPRRSKVSAPASETPSVPTLADIDRIQAIAGHFRHIIELLGLDLKDPNLTETPERVAKMYLELFAGLSEGAEPKVTFFPNDERYTAMVMEKDIPFYSLCSHHFVPFYGHAHVAYIPNESIVGLSKMARIVEFYARRPQLQERLTEQIASYMAEKLDPQGVMPLLLVVRAQRDPSRPDPPPHCRFDGRSRARARRDSARCAPSRSRDRNRASSGCSRHPAS